MIALTLLLGFFLLAEAASVTQRSAPTTLYPKCFTAFVMNDYEWSNTNDASTTSSRVTPTDDRENYMFSFDNGKMRSDWLDETNGVRVLTSQLVDGVSLRETFVYDYLNGTVQCFSMPIVASAVDAGLPAALAYAGTRVCTAHAGASLCDEWRCHGNCVLKSRPSQAVSHMSLVTHPVTGLPVELRLGDLSWEQTLIFSQASACKPGSLDASLFSIPAGLQCTNY